MSKLEDLRRWDPTASLVEGAARGHATLLDERGRPDFRDLFGQLAQRSTQIATAVTRVRLSTVDLHENEIDSVEHLRVLVAELNALHLHGEVRSLQVDPQRVANLELLLDLLHRGRLSVRSAPLAGWSPDFTVFSGPEGATAALIGTHWFERPYPHPGPALASVHTGAAAELAGLRHAELWERAHDVGPAVRSILALGRRTREVASRGRSHRS